MRSSKNLVVLASPLVVALIIIALVFWLSPPSTKNAISQTNNIPIADAGLDQGITLPSTVQLDGSGSTDLDGDSITYSWTLVSIPTGSSADLSDSSAIRPTFDADMLGTYTVELVVNDGMDDSFADTVLISTDNIIPVADAGLDQTVSVSDTVQLDGSGSFDDDQDPLTYSWSIVSVPVGSTAALSDPAIVNPTFVADLAGEYEIYLIVNDGAVDSPADTVIISTNNSIPVADAGTDQSVAASSTVQLDGSGSFDADSNPLTYSWSIISRPSGSTAILSDVSAESPTFDVDIPGIYVAQLIVNDGTLDSDPDTVVISRQNTTPILDPVGDQNIAAGCSTTINLTATDAENDTLTFSATPLPLPANSSLDSNTGEFVITPDQSQVGEISLTFIVSDGEFSDSELITIDISGGTSSLTGRVTDANDAANSIDTPVVGATISIIGTCATTTTDATGNFSLSNLPGGLQVFDIDTSTANAAPDGSSYAGFRESLLLAQNAPNDITRPFFLPRIDAASVTTVDPLTTTVVDNPNIDVSIEIPPNTAMGSDGNEFTGEISISEVPEGFAPAELPEGLEPGLLVTIQPVGVTFDTPVPITFPNNDGLAPGSEVDIWSLDPDTGQFTIVGVGVVSADGSVIETVSGGVTAADWHTAGPPPPNEPDGPPPPIEPPPPCDPTKECCFNFGSSVSPVAGSLQEEHTLVSYKSMNQSRALRFEYNSLYADPRPIIEVNSIIPFRTAVPPKVSVSLEIDGVQEGDELFMDTSSLNPDIDETISQSIQLDARTFPTGVYPYRVKVTSNYPTSKFSSFRFGEISVNNQIDSPYGSGWILDGVSRLHIQQDGTALIDEGNGGMTHFKVIPSLTVTGDVVVVPAPPNVAEQIFENDNEIRIFLEAQDYILPTDIAANVTMPGFYDTIASFTPDILDIGTSINSYFIHFDNIGSTSTFINLSGTITFPEDILGVVLFNPELASSDNILGWPATIYQSGPLEFSDQFPGTPTDTVTISPDLKMLTIDLNAGPAADQARVITLSMSSSPDMYSTPRGEFSTLVGNLDGSFTRTMKDGTILNYDSDGLQTSLIDRNGNTINYQYDANNRLTTITDPVGLVTTLTYTGDHLSSITDPASRTTAFEHDASGNLTKITDPDGTFRQFTYDADHKMVTQTSKRNFVTTYQYNFAGQVISAMRPDNSQVQLTPSSSIALPDFAVGIGTEMNPTPVKRLADIFATYTDGNGNTSTYEFNDFGSITRVTDGLGRVTNFVRDQDNNSTQTIDPGGNITESTYDNMGNILTRTEVSIGATTTFTYTTEGFNQLKTFTDPLNNTTTYNYDTNGDLISTIDPLNNQTTFSYNSLGLQTSQTDTLNNTVTFQYDPVTFNLDGTIDQLSNQTIFTLDSAGNIASTTDPEGKTTTNNYDTMNRLTQVVDPDLALTIYNYDDSGNLISITDDRNKTTTFAYDERERVTSKTDPLGNSDTFVYDGNGNITSHTNRKGQTISFTYDADNQLVSKVVPGNGTVTYTYDNSGNLLTLNDPDSKITFEYDGVDRVTKFSTVGSPNYPQHTNIFTYDLNGNRIHTSHGNFDFTYDALNRQTSWIQNNGTQDWTFVYDALGRRVETDHVSGVKNTYEYDAKSQLTKLTNFDRFGGIISSFDYSYDLTGNRTTLDTFRRDVTVTSPLNYTYDDLYRVTDATNPLGGTPEAFSYDSSRKPFDIFTPTYKFSI